VSLQLLNATNKLQADWKFFRAAERVYNQQASPIELLDSSSNSSTFFFNNNVYCYHCRYLFIFTALVFFLLSF